MRMRFVKPVNFNGGTFYIRMRIPHRLNTRRKFIKKLLQSTNPLRSFALMCNLKMVLGQFYFLFAYWIKGYVPLCIEEFGMRIIFFPEKRSEKCRNLEQLFSFSNSNGRLQTTVIFFGFRSLHNQTTGPQDGVPNQAEEGNRKWKMKKKNNFNQKIHHNGKS